MSAMVDRLDRAIAGLLDRAAASHIRAILLILLISGGVALPGLQSLPVTDRDEARYAQASKQMMETGDYIDIRNQENPRWKKPVGIYWLQVLSAKTVGYGAESQIWVYRLPSALAIMLAAALTYWALIPLITAPPALIAGLMVGSTATTAVEAHIAKTDAVLLACTVLAFGGLVRIYKRRQTLTGFSSAHFLLWLGLGLGFLVKGPIILIPFIGCLIWLVMAERSTLILRAIAPLKGLALFALIAAPWYIAIHLKTDGAFFAESLGKDLLGKVGQASEKHGGPLGYYLATFWVTFWPWAPLALLAIPMAWSRRNSDATRLIAGWIIPCWAVFALTTTKLPHYVLPVIPAIAALIGLWIHSNKSLSTPIRLISTALFLLGALGAALFAIAPRPYFEAEYPPSLIIAAITITLTCLIATYALATNRRFAFMAAGVASLMLLMPTLTKITAKNLETVFLTPELHAAHRAFKSCAPRPIISAGYQEMSLVFMGGTDTKLTSRHAAAEALRAPQKGGRVLLRLDTESTLTEFEQSVGAPLEILDQITGTNYNSGREITVALVALKDDPLLAPCKPTAK